MASARLASLLAQRKAGVGGLYSGDKIRILSPQNSSVSSIAKQAASRELDIMVSRYNNGEVTNEDMRAFLVKTSNNPGLSGSDKLDVENQIKDFDNRIIKDKLEANYKAAPDGTLQQMQAASQLASYYQNRAATMAEGTPAQSQNLQDAATWTQRANDIKTSIAKVASQNLRYQQEQKVNQLPSNSSEKALAKAQMYQELYDKAVADGDAVGANKYAAYYEQEMTNAQELADKEAITSEKTDIKNIMGQLVDLYHDGKINESQYLDALAELAPRVDATNDYGLINALNRTTDTIQKNLQRGGLKRTTTASGLPAVTGKGSSGGLGANASPDQVQDFNYSDNLRLFKQAFEDGKIDAAQYRDAVGAAIIKHADEISENISLLEEQAQANPNAKILFNGKKTKISDALDSLYNDYEDIKGQAQAVEKGRFAFVEVPPGEFNKSGGVSSGKSFATYKAVDLNNLPKDQYAVDTEGVYHKIDLERRPLTLEEMANVYNGTLQDANGNLHKVITDSAGNQYVETGRKQVKVYKFGTSDYHTVEQNSEGFTPAYSNAEAMKKQDEQLAKQAGITIKSDADRAKASKILQEKFNAGLKGVNKSQTGLRDQNGKELSLTGIPQKPLDINKAIKSGGLTTEPVAPVKEEPPVIKPIYKKPDLTPEQAGITPNMQVAMPKATVVPQTGQAYEPVKTPTLKLATQAPSPVAQLNKNQPAKPIAAPPISSTQAKNNMQAAQQKDYSITGSLNALKKNVLGFFGIK